jgi:hypothetical protein
MSTGIADPRARRRVADFGCGKRRGLFDQRVGQRFAF